MYNNRKKLKLEAPKLPGSSDQSFNPFRMTNSKYLFNTGTSVNWTLALPAILSAFRGADCLELVEIPDTMNKPGDALPNLSPFAEVEFTDVEPVINVEQFTLDFDIQTTTLLAQQLADANTTYQQDQVLLNNQLYEARKANRERVAKRNNEIRDYEKTVQQQINNWQVKKEKFVKKVTSAIKVIYESFGPSAMAVIKEEYKANQFRRLWFKLNSHYSADSGGRESRSAVMKLICSVIWDGKDLNAHLGYMRSLYTLYEENRAPIDNDMKLQWTFESIQRSKNKKFNDVLSYALHSNQTYEELVTALQLRASADGINNQIEMISASSFNNVVNNNSEEVFVVGSSSKPLSKSQKKKQKATNALLNAIRNANAASVEVGKTIPLNNCTQCGKPNHTAANCWSNVTCGTCGLKGHPAERCRQFGNKKKNNTDKVNLSDTFNAKFPQT